LDLSGTFEFQQLSVMVFNQKSPELSLSAFLNQRRMVS
jgi:hypothetical protein